MNSRDLCLLEELPRLAEAGVDAFKIEGRMKSPLYVAVVARVYREALDDYRKGTFNDPAKLDQWLSQLQAVATRPFTPGFIDGHDDQLQDPTNSKNQNRAEFCGMVQGYDAERSLIQVEQRANFGPGDPLWLLAPKRDQSRCSWNTYMTARDRKLTGLVMPASRFIFPLTGR